MSARFSKGVWGCGGVGERNKPPYSHTSILPYLTLFLLLAACDNSFDPLTEDPAEFFALYGVLDTEADTQFVRVSPLRDRLEAEPADLQVMVHSTRLGTGEQVAWQDSLVRLDDGSTGLLFYTTMPVAPGESFRLEARRSASEVTRAFTQLPPQTGLLPGPVFRDFNLRFIQKVVLPGVQRIPTTAVRYRVQPPGAAEPVAIRLPLFSAAELIDGGLELTVQLQLDRSTILQRLDLPVNDTTVVLLDIGLEVERLSEEWDTPGTPRNIQNGFGFFGSVSRYVETWTLDAEATRRIGFQPPG